ncbi:MAG TPA: hypothetical protein VGL86_21800 [Polyangia bacterium]|jgi:hypothetical protein
MVKPGILIALVASLASSTAARAQVRVRLVTPPTLPGDGETAVQLGLRAEDGKALADFGLDVDAGTLGARHVVDGGVDFDWVPPRVGAPRDVHVGVMSGGALVSKPVTIAVTPPPRTIGQSGSGGALALRAPAMLVLGQDGTATVRLHASVAPALAVNVGTLSPPVADGAGAWRATYTPPTQRYPEVAIIAAAAAGAVDALALPLYGVGRVETRTKPNARITLAFGDARFGPFRTDASGMAMTPVIAPPGVRRGSTLAVDSLGNEKETPFDLGTPPFSRLTALCVDDRVHVFVVDGAGALAGDDAPELTASAGSLEAATRVGPGHFVARWQPDAAETAEVRAAIAGDAASHGSCRVRRPAEPPIALELEADRKDFVAGSGAIVVRARLRWADPRGGRAVPIALVADDGTVEADAPNAGDGGVVTARWRPDDRFAGKKSATLRATTTTPSLSATLTIVLVAGPPARVTVARAPRWLVADGRHARLEARVQDAFGNPARAEGLVADAHGAPLTVGAGDDGVATIDYVTPSAARGGDDRVHVRDGGGVEGAVVVRLEPPPRPLSLDARAGLIDNFGKIASAFVAADLDWRPRWLRRRLTIGLSAGVYPGSSRQSDTTTSTSLSLSVTGVPVLARVGFVQPIGRFALGGGVGGGLVVVRVATSSPSAGSDASTLALGAFEAHVGGDVKLGVGRVLVEAGFLYAPESSGAVVGNFGGLAITAGYRVGL